MDRPPLAARLGLVVIAALLMTFVGWASIAEVQEIARGEGKIIPISKTQIIQSSEAGVVQEIAVTIGQTVSKGDLILQLDDTVTASSLGESAARARALRAQIARLELEEKGDLEAEYICPESLQEVAPGICQNEARLLRARADNIKNKRSVLIERRTQRMNELDEANANISRLEENLSLAQREADLLEPMVKRKLVAQTELLRVQKELSETRGQLESTRESVERIEASIKEATLQIEELALQVQQEALVEKTQALAELSVIEETIRGATDRVARTDIRSPVDGIINTLEVNTIGAYVEPGTVVAGVVPTSDTLLVEARISPRDVAFVRPGQPALIKVSAYDFSIYGGLEGEVENISADSLVDQNTGETFYQVRVKTDQAELVRDGRSHKIIPGMIATADIMTGKKTILAYLMKPINKARTEALRER
ncbi:HlyD family type I secretion periplasmic adaptor subunit [Nitratireductor aquimarinus]|uniref:Membrane fusion protein (MFP) family protein n=1 Tax=Nitratireductor aquimarinus TaxID=889300 RepID=A0ABU4AKY2_9HYPH|nr:MULTISPECIES: HlyD family type I secretion periplasmic adaptor subunit [Nitratireductor]MBN7775748.1 HlyD family type I secretion periplasmic adaptor subunit [Nitratireductor pacificus]MBN7781787.1 HlyD family type I secretion periplasmic adaptor subunit [Nitratireductor pacificus]MBN7790593.1 HlyD family type I secretion periplasmic adaptor subunit [Nitratireductor aquimarinus]MBY6098495.1 HlyD family type I secretion periplasmic adaptor subunit [Nitratireductor aquimarinus]MCA1261974.1 Hl